MGARFVLTLVRLVFGLGVVLGKWLGVCPWLGGSGGLFVVGWVVVTSYRGWEKPNFFWPMHWVFGFMAKTRFLQIKPWFYCNT